MKSSTLQRIGWVLFTFCIPLYTHSQTKPVKKEPVSSISGKVTIKGKGASGIIVGLRAADPLNRQSSFNKATTDEEGNYRITNVLPGTYQVIPYAPTFVISGDRGGKTLLIAASETIEGVDFALNRGGVITGKATDSEGRPLIEEHIILVAVEGTNQGPQHYMVGQLVNQTDDRGIYRIFGIPQGKYRVGLGQSDEGVQIRGPRTSLYKQTFHPGVTDPSKATVIEVSEGSEATNVDITAGRTLPTFTASGQIVDGETGKPLAKIRYGLQTLGNDRSSFVSARLSSDSQGEFKLENLTPGKYAVFIVPQENGDMHAEPVTFDLIDQNVTGLLLKTSQGASISGVVFMESTTDRSVIARLSQMRIHTYVATEGPGDSWIRPVGLSHDRGFRIGGLRGGTAHFSLVSTDGGQVSGFTLIRVEREGIAQPNGLEVKEGEQVTGVRLIVGYGNGSIRGLIKLEDGELPATARFRVWLTNPGDDPTLQRSWPSPNVDSRGRFIVEGLPAGIYEVNAFVHIPESRNAPPQGKKQVTVTDGAVTEVTVTVVQNPNRGPTIP